MLHVHYGNRLENLLSPLARAVQAHQAGKPLEPVTIIVPNRVIEQFIRLGLSEILGVAANLHFPFLRAYFREQVEKAASDLRIIEADELQLFLYDRFRNLETLRERDLEPVRKYLPGDESSQGRHEIESYLLADELARLFREYAFSRTDLLTEWPKQPRFEGTSYEAVERWQRRLWLSLFNGNGAEVHEGDYRKVFLPEAFETLKIEQLGLPHHLHVFGLAYLAPAFVRIFEKIGQHREISLYAITPCLEFREDAAAAGLPDTSWASRHEKIGSRLADSEDPFRLTDPREATPLRLWARPGREYLRLLNELANPVYEDHFHVMPGKRPTLLGRLQKDIVLRTPEKNAAKGSATAADDGSLRILACPGIRREVECIANMIWALIRESDRKGGPAGESLRFHEIAVLVPDKARDDYLPHIEAVFSELHDIPLNHINRPIASESRVAEAVELLLRLPLGRLSRVEMLRLLTHPALSDPKNEAGVENWEAWCDALNVVFGADQDDFEGTYITEDLYSWDRALRRLSLGAFMTGERSGDRRIFDEEGSPCLPFEVSQDKITSVGQLVETARRLLSEARYCRSHALSLEEWGRLLESLITTYLHASNPVDERILRRCIAEINSMGKANIDLPAVPFAVAQARALSRLSSVEGVRGRLINSGVVAGALSALRSIPFKVIFLVGLGEGKFPATEHANTLDLRMEKRRAGDVSPTEQDRYHFLETLLAARQQLFLSYVSRDAQTGEELEPATVIKELEYLLRGYVGDNVGSLTVHHPVSRYDRSYFPELHDGGQSEGEDLSSVDPAAARGARMAALRKDLERHMEGTPLPEAEQAILETVSTEVARSLEPALRLTDIPKPEEVRTDTAERASLSITAIRKFLECPVQGSARYALGLFEEEEPSDEEDEPLKQSRLDRTVLLRAAFWRAAREGIAAPDAYREGLRRRQLEGAAPTGPFAESDRTIAAGVLSAWSANVAEQELTDLDQWQVIRLGRADEFADVSEIHPPLILKLKLPRPGGGTRNVEASLYGALDRCSPEFDASLRFVERGSTYDSDFLGPFLSAVALWASGLARGTSINAYVIPGDAPRQPRIRRVFEPMGGADAKAYLARIVTDLLSEAHDYFLPAEAVFAAHKVLRSDPDALIVPAIRKVQSGTWGFHPWESGPVHFVSERFEPPSEQKAREIINRRFGPLLDTWS